MTVFATQAGDEPIRDVVRTAIRKTLEACSPKAHPFLVLREAGVVAELRGQILAELGDRRREVTATIEDLIGRGYKAVGEHRNQKTLRVQLEMKPMTEEVAMDARGGLKAERIDLTVLREDAHLYCYGGGPGDVVALIRARHIEAFVEVKASPSMNLGELHRYLLDMERLIALVRGSQRLGAVSHGFFVLLDKSAKHFSDFGAHWSMEWSCPAGEERCISGVLTGCPGRGNTEFARRKLQESGLKLRCAAPTDGRPYIEVFKLLEGEDKAAETLFVVGTKE